MSGPLVAPISDSLQKHIAEALAAIPSGKSVAVTTSVSTTGAVATFGAKKTVKGADVTVGGWAGRAWGGSGWSAGSSATVAW